MLPAAALCLRCQLRLLKYRANRSRPFRRALLSLAESQLLGAQEVDGPESRDTEYAARRSTKPSTGNRVIADRTYDPSAARLESIFESNRHKVEPGPIRTRYSRRLIENDAQGSEEEESERSQGLKVDAQVPAIPATKLRSVIEGNLVEVERMLQRDAQSPEIWNACKNIDVAQIGASLERRCEAILAEVMQRMIRERLKQRHLDVLKLPDILEQYRSWKMISMDWLLRGLGVYLNSIVSTLIVRSQKPDDKSQQSPGHWLIDVLYLWQLYFHSFAPNESSQAPLDTWPGLISADDVTASRSALPRHFLGRFEQLFPGQDKRSAGQFGSMAALTYLLLDVASERGLLKAKGQLLSKSFINTFTQVAYGTSGNFAEFYEFLSANQREEKAYQALERRWNTVHQRLLDEFPAESQPDSTDSNSSTFMRASSQQYTSSNPYSRGIWKATYEKNAKTLNNLWDQFLESFKNQKTTFDAPLAIHADFLWAFVSFRSMASVTAVWSSMEENHLSPSITHWTALLEILRKHRELNKVKQIWKRMRDADVSPDNQAWTTYISAHLDQRDWHGALREIDEMGKSWADAATKLASQQTTTTEPQPQPRPTSEQTQYLPSIVPINASITGLLNMRRPEPAKAAKAVLNWAGTHSLTPDVVTYNVLLRNAARQSHHTEMRSILADMQSRTLKPDANTINIILNAVVHDPASRFHTLTPTEQEAAVFAEIDGMLAGGVAATSHTYGTVLHALLHGRRPNLPAARAVLGRLVSSGVRISAHIYTILITHYFAAAPPDLGALDSLWKRIWIERAPVDHVAYDRMVEGYAKIGEVERMLLFLRRMPAAGKVPGWLALEAALRALVRKEEWELCARLVEDVSREGGLLRLGKRGWKGEKEFWGLVEELKGQGLIPAEAGAKRKARNEDSGGEDEV